MLKALIWDVDGTVAETERDGHRVAFNQAFAECGLPWHWGVSAYGRLLAVSGGRERLLAYMGEREDVPAEASARERLARSIHASKSRHYASLVAQRRLPARPGVQRLIDQCADAGIALAVATTTSRGNVEALFPHLFGRHWRERFQVLVCAEDAPSKKPDPLVYRLALARLRCAPSEALAIEDSPAGLAAANAAGVACLITRSSYFADADFIGASWVCDDLDAPAGVADLEAPCIDLPLLRAMLALQTTRIADAPAPKPP